MPALPPSELGWVDVLDPHDVLHARSYGTPATLPQSSDFQPTAIWRSKE